MFLDEFRRYARPIVDTPANPCNLLMFCRSIRMLSIPSYIQAQPQEPIQLYLQLSTRSQCSNALQACQRSFFLRPQEITLNNAFLASLSAEDDILIAVHARSGIVSGRVAEFTIKPGSIQAVDIQEFLSGQGQFVEVKDPECSAVLSVSFAMHQLTYLEPNTIYDTNLPPLMFVPQGYYEIMIHSESHFLNGTLLNRPTLFPGYVLRVSELGGRLLKRNSLQRIGLSQLRLLIRQHLVDHLAPAVEARNDVVIDRNAATLNLDRISLLVTAHTGIFPISQKYMQISSKPAQESHLAEGDYDFYQLQAENLKFSAAAFLVFQLVVQASIFLAGASSEQIDEPFPAAMSYSVCFGVWKRENPITDVKMSSGISFGVLPAVTLEDLSAVLSFECEEIGFKEINYSDLISTDNRPSSGYFGEEEREIEAICGDIGEIGDLGLTNTEQQTGAVEKAAKGGKLVVSELLQQFPVNIKLRLYRFQPMISGYFGKTTIGVRMIATSTLLERQIVDSGPFDTAFSEMRSLEFQNSFCGAIAEVELQLLEYRGGQPAVAGQQFFYTTGEAFEAKCRADGFVGAKMARMHDFDSEFNNEDFFELIMQENRLDTYFDREPPEIAYFQAEFTLVPRLAVDYELREDIKAITLQNQLYWQAMRASEAQKAHVDAYISEMQEAFNTPERALAQATISQNSIERVYSIHNEQQLRCNIIYDGSLQKNGLYSLSLIYPSPLVLQSLGFTVEFAAADQKPCFQIDEASLSELCVDFAFSFAKQPKFKVVRIVFALYQEDIDLGRISCLFSIVDPQICPTNSFYLPLPFKRGQAFSLVFRKLDSEFLLASPNVNGAFLEPLDIPQRKIIESQFRLIRLPATIPVTFPGFTLLEEPNPLAGVIITEVEVGNDIFMLLTMSGDFATNCGKNKSVFMLTNGPITVMLLFDFLSYCCLECSAGTRITLPEFDQKSFVSYPPHTDGRIRCFSRGVEHVYINGDAQQFVSCIIASEAQTMQNKYFIKVKGGELKHVQCKVEGKRIQALSEFQSLAKIVKCHITDEGWALTVEVGHAFSGYRSICRLYVEDEDETIRAVILLEMVWE